MTTQLSLALPFPPGWCDQNRFNPEVWPTHIKDAAGRRWLVLHVGGHPDASFPAVFCCEKPRTVEYHHIPDFEAVPA